MTNEQLLEQRQLMSDTLQRVATKFKNVEFVQFLDLGDHSQAFVDDGNAHFCLYNIDVCVCCGNNDDRKALRVVRAGVKALENVGITFANSD